GGGGGGAAGGKKGARHVAGQLDEAAGQRDSRNTRRADVTREVRELLHLLRRCVGQLGTAVADVDVPEPAQAVEVFLAADVADRGAAPADVDHGLGVVDRVM